MLEKLTIKRSVVALVGVLIILLGPAGEARVMAPGLDLATRVDRLIAKGDLPRATEAVRNAYPAGSAEELAVIRQFSLAVLQAGLSDSDEYERCYSANALAAAGNDRAMALLENLFRQATLRVFDPVLKMVVADGLGAIGDARAVAVLERLYREVGPMDREILLAGLAQAPDRSATPFLTVIALETNHRSRLVAIEGLGRLGDPEAIPLLQRLMTSVEGPLAKTITARSLVRLGDDSQLDYLIDRLAHEGNYDVNEMAALALGEARDSRVVAPLRKALHHPDIGISMAAATALTHHNDLSGLPVLRTAIHNGNSSVRWELRRVLNNVDFQHGGLELATTALDSSDFDLRMAALQLLGKPKCTPALPVLRESLLHNNDPLMRAAIAAALGRIGGLDSIAPLMALVSEEASPVRHTAAEALRQVSSRMLEERNATPAPETSTGLYSWSR